MRKGICVHLAGANAMETAHALVLRLMEMGYPAELVDAAAVKRLGGPKAAAYACSLLVRNGVIAVVTAPRLKPDGERLDLDVSPHDTPDFAAEKVVDELAAVGVVRLASVDYTPEEEDQIRKRLVDLGYIE